MADVIDLTEISSDDEDAFGNLPVSLSAVNGTGVVNRTINGGVPLIGKVEPISYDAITDVKVLQNVGKGRSPVPRKGRVADDGDPFWGDADTPHRLSTWGDPLPPESDTFSIPGMREKGIGSSSVQDHFFDGMQSNVVENAERGNVARGTNASHSGIQAGTSISLPSPAGTSLALPRLPSPPAPANVSAPISAAADSADVSVCRHFWKAGDYEAHPTGIRVIRGAMDHVRVHPKFLHSNATSHKWALGAVAELLDNAVDEVQNGATFVSIDKMINPRDQSPALIIQDDGGGMTPDNMRQCMSLGYSRKTSNTTIGQYGNGFKTSTMRLGADVIVFSRYSNGSKATQSIGMLSYTFLRKTGHEDVVVPMIDYEVTIAPKGRESTTRKILRSTAEDWQSNLASLVKWSPYGSESELLSQFEDLGWHGTKVIVYNLWFNDDGVLELDFETDPQDIQLRGGIKQDKGKPVQQQLAQQHIANRYHHSLRVYASILYLQMPRGFQIILRGKPVDHHSIASDLKFPEQIVYKPQIGSGKEANKEISVITVIGFTKEAPLINVHGFNVYHKNRLIMPFWKVLHDNSSRGRGVVGVLEANFVEPAHDKQDFERTAVLLRLETRLKQMTVEYWNLHCRLIGYQPNTKAGKAVGKQPSDAVDYPSPIASITPAEAPSKSGGTPTTQEPGSSIAPRVYGEEGRPVKAEPVEIGPDSLKRPNSGNAGPGDHGSKRQRVTSNAQPESSVVVTDLMEENSQLRSRCVDYEQHVKTLGSKVESLEKELLLTKVRYTKLQKELEESRGLQNTHKRIANTVEREVQNSMGNVRPSFERNGSADDRNHIDRAPVVGKPRALLPVVGPLKVEQQ